MGRSRQWPAKGEGYTTRVDGRKILTSKVLEERLEESQRQYKELLKQNQALREKEAEQLRCLDMYEAWVKTCSSDADAAAAAGAREDSIDSSQLPAAARLQRRVQKLKQILRPHAPDAQPSAAGTTGNSTGTHADAGSTARDASGVPSSAGSHDTAAPGAGKIDEQEKMARWFASATPEDLNYFRNMTSEELAVRLRSIIGRLGIAHWAAGTTGGIYGSNGNSSEANVYSLLDEIGKMCCLQTMANEAVMAKAYNINMDTLQVEPWPKTLWPSVVAAAQLSPDQRKTLAEAYQTYRKGTAQIMEQQHGFMRQLQTIMYGAVGSGQHRDTSAASAAVRGNVRPACPQHFMSLATGGAVPGTAAADADTPTAGDPAPAAPAGPDDAAWTPILDAMQPLSAEEFAMLTDYLQDCKDQAASGATAGPGGSSSSSSWLAPPGVLALQEAEKAEKIMEQLSRISGLARVQMHVLIICFVNLLTTAQRAEVVLAAYPYMVDPPAFCGCVAEQDGYTPTAAP